MSTAAPSEPATGPEGPAGAASAPGAAGAAGAPGAPGAPAAAGGGAAEPRLLAGLVRWRGFVWVLATWAFAFTRPDRIASHVTGDSGDAFFNLSVLRWDAIVLGDPGRWDGYMAGLIFHGDRTPMAYSETHLGIAPVFAALQALTGSGVVAMNLVFIATWIIGCEATYRLAGRVIGPRRPASVLAAVAWTFSTIRVSHTGHFHLALGALIPVILLLALDVLDRPRWWRAVLLGVVYSAMTLSASYYGVLMATTLVVVVAAHVVRQVRRRGDDGWRPLGRSLAALGLAAVTVGVLCGPVVVRYLDLQEDPAFRRGYEPAFAAQWEDLRSTVAPWAGWVPFVNDAPRNGERFAFIGVVAGAGAVVAAVALARRRATLAAPRTPGGVGGRWVLATVGAAGVVALLVALGRNVSVFGLTLPAPYDAAARWVPGFAGIRAPVRMLILFQLALVLLAAVGIDAVLRRLARIDARLAVAGVLAVGALLTMESNFGVTWARVPTEGRDGAANALLAERPDGVVLELPMPGPQHGRAWPFVEAPRMVLATIDANARVGGYSGFFAADYPGRVALFNQLPSLEALALADRFGVRYVVARTAAPESGIGWLDAEMAASGFASMSPEAARALAAGLPRSRVAQVDEVPGAVVIELRPAP